MTTPGSESTRVRKAITDNVVYRLLAQAISAVIYIVLVRILSEVEFGVYQIFYTLLSVIASVLSLGISVTLSRYLPEYYSQKKFSYASDLFSIATRYRLVSNIIILGLLFFLWDQVGAFFKISEYKSLFYLFIGITITHFQCRLLNIALSSYLLQQWSSGLTAAFSLVKLVGYIVLALDDVSLFAVMSVDLVAFVFWYVASTWARRRFIPSGSGGDPMPRDQKRRVYRFGLLNNFNDVGTFTLNSRVDNLFIAAMLNPALVGAYAFCTQLEQMLQKLLPTRFFGAVVRAVTFRLSYVDDHDKVKDYFSFLMKLNYLGAFPALAVVAAIPESIINTIFGGKFVEYSFVLVATFIFSFVSSFQRPVSVIAELGERAGIVLASKIFAVYNVLANLALIPIFGIMGAVISTGTAILFKNLFIWFFVRKNAVFRGAIPFFLRQFFIWSLCFFSIKAADNYLSDWLTLAAAALILAVFGIIALKFAYWSEFEKDLLKRLGGARFRPILRLLGI